MAQPIQDCFSSGGDYATCVAGNRAGNDRYSTWAVDFNRYSDVDSNPYVVGSSAYNAAHGLPLPPSWIDRTDAAAEQRRLLDTAAAEILTRSGQPVLGEPVANAGATGNGSPSLAPGLIPLALIALALLLLKS